MDLLELGDLVGELVREIARGPHMLWQLLDSGDIASAIGVVRGRSILFLEL